MTDTSLDNDTGVDNGGGWTLFTFNFVLASMWHEAALFISSLKKHLYHFMSVDLLYVLSLKWISG